MWGSISSSELQALQSFQNKVLSIIERARFKDPWPKKWLIVVNLVPFDRCVMVYYIRLQTNNALKAYGICSNRDILYQIIIR